MRAIDFDAEAIATLDRVVHEPARLSILACLSVVDEADFVFLQAQTGMTGGNLSSHVSRLEKSEYVTVDKQFIDSRPRTCLKLTKQGRRALKSYLKTMGPLLTAVSGG